MDRSELEASWARTKSHLTRAIAAFLASSGDVLAAEQAQDYLDHNELEIAADVIADACIEHEHELGPATWLALADAAAEMQLVERLAEWRSRGSRYPCPCCGHLVFDEPPGSYAICPVCFWEDDLVQLRWPKYAGGANRPNLIDAQKEHAAAGAMEYRFTGLVRAPAEDEPLEPAWRPIDPATDGFEQWGAPKDPWPEDYTTLYWWRDTYWRAAPDVGA